MAEKKYLFRKNFFPKNTKSRFSTLSRRISYPPSYQNRKLDWKTLLLQFENFESDHVSLTKRAFEAWNPVLGPFFGPSFKTTRPIRTILFLNSFWATPLSVRIKKTPSLWPFPTFRNIRNPAPGPKIRDLGFPTTTGGRVIHQIKALVPSYKMSPKKPVVVTADFAQFDHEGGDSDFPGFRVFLFRFSSFFFLRQGHNNFPKRMVKKFFQNIQK